MAVRQHDLRWIVEASATLSERLGGAFLPGGSGPDSGAAGLRLRAWRDRVAHGDDVRFEKRLRWDGLDRGTALRLLGPVRLKAAGPLPAWAHLLGAAAADADPGRGPGPQEVFEPAAPRPFEHLLWRLVPASARRLQARLGPARRRLCRSALIDLERALLDRLCRTAARTLCADFDTYRAAGAVGRPGGRGGTAAAGRQSYLDFVRDRGGAGFAPWLLRQPLLARLLATCCRQWIDATVELLRRLDRDAAAIRTAFGLPDRPLQIAGVTSGLSDPHRDGRTVCRIRFGSGGALMYKPRSLAIDRHFSDWLAELDARCGIPRLRRPAVLDRGDYGWAAPVDASPCADRDAVARFYRRAGMLTCLGHALGASDLHAGNLIAAGAHPVPVDLECLVGAPVAEPRLPDETDPPRPGAPAGCVIRTGLLPTLQRDGGRPFRIAGGLAAPDLPDPVEGPVAHVNTDWMRWRGGLPRPGGRDRHAPVIDGCPQRGSDHVDAILDGFRTMYAALLDHRAALTAAPALRRLDAETFRVLIRHTRTYAALLDQALGPPHVASGADWSIALDVIAAPALAAADRPACWATRTAERMQLEQLDIPIFTGRIDRAVLQSPAGIPLAERLDPAGYAASARLAGLDPGDCARQVHWVRTSFAIADVKRRHRRPRARAAARGASAPAWPRLLADVQAIVDLLQRLAIRDGSTVTWLGVGPRPGAAPGLEPVGLSLYDGRVGIALFLAAAAEVLGRGDARTLAVQTLDPICARLAAAPRRDDLTADIGVGGALGLGGLIYGLARAGAALRVPRFMAAARRAAAGITPAAVEAHDVLDVLSGTAGALLGLLALYRMSGDPTLLPRARQCGEHLLARRTVDPATGRRTWPAPDGGRSAGFAHGAAGIGCALRRLARATGDDAFRRAAADAWAGDRVRPAPDRPGPDRKPAAPDRPERHPASGTGPGGCPDRRPPADRPDGADRAAGPPVNETPDPDRAHDCRRWERSWCRGAAGIAAARLAAFDGGPDGIRRAARDGGHVVARVAALDGDPDGAPDEAAARTDHARADVSAGGRAGDAARDAAETRAALDQALVMAADAADLPGEGDSLCCGRLGRADVLLSAAGRLHRPDLRLTARALGARATARALAAGQYAVGVDEGFRPGLFQGAAGIGYLLLRLQAPNRLPSVLLWE